jgi:hypothetical protein
LGGHLKKADSGSIGHVVDVASVDVYRRPHPFNGCTRSSALRGGEAVSPAQVHAALDFKDRLETCPTNRAADQFVTKFTGCTQNAQFAVFVVGTLNTSAAIQIPQITSINGTLLRNRLGAIGGLPI